MHTMDIIEQIDAERIRQGKSVPQMAEELGLSFSAYYHWLEGRSSPRLSQLLKVMDGLGLTLVVHGGKRDAA